MSTTATGLCPRCGGRDVYEELCRSGPHYGQVICGTCSAHLKWLPRPRVATDAPPAKILEAARRCHRKLAKLQGASESQRAWAACLRSRMLAEAVCRGDHARAAVIRAVSDPTWFIACSGKEYEAIRWPVLDQLSPESVTPSLNK